MSTAQSSTAEAQSTGCMTVVEKSATQPFPAVHGRWKMELRYLLVISGFCAFFLYYAYMPLAVTDVWGHVAYGNWILDHRQLPTEEPFVALAAGIPIVDTAWLGQVLLALAGRSGHPASYQLLHATTVLLTYLILARAFFLQSQNLGVAALGTAGVWFAARHRNAIIRPEVFGGLCFAVLIMLIVQVDQRRSREQICFEPNCRPARDSWCCWFGVPLLFVAWANLHGSYIVGIALLGCYAAGQVLESVWESQSVAGVLGDRLVRRWGLLTLLALAGTLVNPYGSELLVHTLQFSSNPNLKAIMEWYPLVISSPEWIPMAGSWVLLTILLRHSRVRVTPGDALQIAVFGLSTCERVRMISWYAPAVVLALTPHFADVARQCADALRGQKRGRAIDRISTALGNKSLTYTLLAGLAVWAAIAISPIRQAFLFRRAISPALVYSNLTPLGVTRYLRQHPPRGFVAAPQWWGDWLVWDGPRDLQLFTTTNSVHVVPPGVWRDYLAMARGAPELGEILQRYQARTLIICKALQPRLTKAIKAIDGWAIVYEDDMSIILELKKASTVSPFAGTDLAAEPTRKEQR